MIEATRSIAAPPERAFEFLSDLRNHRQLEERFLVHKPFEADALLAEVRQALGS